MLVLDVVCLKMLMCALSCLTFLSQNYFSPGYNYDDRCHPWNTLELSSESMCQSQFCEMIISFFFLIYLRHKHNRRKNLSFFLFFFFFLLVNLMMVLLKCYMNVSFHFSVVSILWRVFKKCLKFINNFFVSLKKKFHTPK